LNVILLSNINPLFTSILYKIFVFAVPPIISSGIYGEAGNKAYKTDKGTDNRVNNKINKTARTISTNRGITIINSGLSYIAASYTTSATISITIFINVFSVRRSSFSLTG